MYASKQEGLQKTGICGIQDGKPNDMENSKKKVGKMSVFDTLRQIMIKAILSSLNKISTSYCQPQKPPIDIRFGFEHIMSG